MSLLHQSAIGLVALLHIAFLVLEIFLWQHPIGRRVFGTSREFAEQSAALAANQGLYNGFIAVGLLWSIWPLGIANNGVPLATFFLLCVVAAGLFGAITVNVRILFVQAVPALIALALLHLTP